MKTLEFQSHLNPDGSLVVPADIAEQLPPNASLRVMLLVPEANEDEEWSRAAATEFLRGYADSDAIYDQLPAR